MHIRSEENRSEPIQPPPDDAKHPSGRIESRKQKFFTIENLRENFIFTDQMMTHFKLEVLEFRIHFELDPLHEHPAKTIQILDDLPNHEIADLTQEELEMKPNYFQISHVPVVPTFWPRRSYDDESLLMDEKQSKALLKKIKAASKEKKIKVKRNKSDNEDGTIIEVIKTNQSDIENRIRTSMRRRSYANRFYQRHRFNPVLVLPALLYDTDLSQDETDQEEF